MTQRANEFLVVPLASEGFLSKSRLALRLAVFFFPELCIQTLVWRKIRKPLYWFL